MAIAGFRDASLVTTPPPQRRPINTVLQVYDAKMVHDAIQTELDRQGQIFYVVPKIAMMDDATFRETFGMDRGAFDALPQWRQIALKKEKGLF